jgi:ABC-type Fe3+-hydroxamate transport system substrate-binding protein
MRIVSLVPSLTEYLWALGLTHEVVGITKFCVHPKEWFETKTRVGGTKQLNFNSIKQLQPDLIIANKEENTKEDIEQLQQEFKVLLTDIVDIEGALLALSTIGKAVDKEKQAKQLIAEIEQDFMALSSVGRGQSFLYFIWQDPAYIVGQKTYINALLEKAGFINACELPRYPSLEEWQTAMKTDQEAPSFIFLSSEPFPFKHDHLAFFQQRFPKSKIMLIDGEMCSWYGSRMTMVRPYFEKLFN